MEAKRGTSRTAVDTEHTRLVAATAGPRGEQVVNAVRQVCVVVSRVEAVRPGLRPSPRDGVRGGTQPRCAERRRRSSRVDETAARQVGLPVERCQRIDALRTVRPCAGVDSRAARVNEPGGAVAGKPLQSSNGVCVRAGRVCCRQVTVQRRVGSREAQRPVS